MIIIALLLTASLLFWAGLGFPGADNNRVRTATIAQVTLPALLLLAAGAFALAHAASI